MPSDTRIARYLRAWREKHRRLGLCSHCTAPAVPGMRKCQRHLDYTRNKRKGVA